MDYEAKAREIAATVSMGVVQAVRNGKDAIEMTTPTIAAALYEVARAAHIEAQRTMRERVAVLFEGTSAPGFGLIAEGIRQTPIHDLLPETKP